MRRLFLFMNVSLDGYVEAPGHDLSWSKGDFDAFSVGESAEVDTILLGRSTYEMMRSFWPTEQAAQVAPDVARFMNERRKVVASHAAFDPGWQNVTVIIGDVPREVRRLKEQDGKSIILLGSNALAASLLPHGLIDEVQTVVNPVVLGEGTPLFAGVTQRVPLQLVRTHAFQSGAVLLAYRPAG